MALLSVQNSNQLRGKSPEVIEAKPSDDEISFITAVRAEIDEYLQLLKHLNDVPSDEVFATLSAITARLVEVRILLFRDENRRLTALRTKEVEPLQEACERLFRIHSRAFAVASVEYEAMRGQV